MFFHPGTFSWLYYSSGTVSFGQQKKRRELIAYIPSGALCCVPWSWCTHPTCVGDGTPPLLAGRLWQCPSTCLPDSGLADLHQGVLVSRLWSQPAKHTHLPGQTLSPQHADPSPARISPGYIQRPTGICKHSAAHRHRGHTLCWALRCLIFILFHQ